MKKVRVSFRKKWFGRWWIEVVERLKKDYNLQVVKDWVIIIAEKKRTEPTWSVRNEVIQDVFKVLNIIRIEKGA